jgi:Trypsin-like serine proteases, typically periplasmic, contain C-terminal PDZ domain
MTLHPRLFPGLFPALAAALLLASCATLDAPPKTKSIPPVARGSTEPVRFAELALGSMRRGMIIGRYVWDIDCAPPYEDVYWTTGRNLRQGSTVEERFAEVLTDAGFDVAGRLNGEQDPEADRRRARFSVQGDLRDIRLELCRRKNWLTGSGKGDSGTGSVRVDWSVFDAATGRLVHRVTTTGVARKDAGVPQGEIMLIEEAFATAAEALAGDAGFRAAVSKGPVPNGGVSSGGALVSTPSRASTQSGASSLPGASSPALVSTTVPIVSSAPVSGGLASSRTPEPPIHPGGASSALAPDPTSVDTPYAPNPTLIVHGPAAGPGYAEDPTARVSMAVVRVGEGSGVVIGEVDGQSVILAVNAGVDTTISVKPAQGVTLDGAVVGRDALAGLALVRVPARLTAAPLRVGEPAVSEPVTAVVKGGGDAASGIVAALRPDPRAGFTLIQADVTGPEPGLGDPLVDEAGNLLGLGRPSAPLAGPAVHGLAVFTPVGEALARMGVVLTQAPLPARPVRIKART